MKADELIGTKVKLKGHIESIRYPKKMSDYEAGGFAIFKFTCDLIEGEMPEDAIRDLDGKYYVSVKGNTPSLKKQPEYTIIATTEVDPVWGLQYNISVMNVEYKMGNKEEEKNFLSYLFTESVIDEMYKTLADPIKELEDKNIMALVSVKGVGAKRAQDMIVKYAKNKHMSSIYAKLAEYGITQNMIDMLTVAYGSSDVAQQKIFENPYVLIKDVRGVGWEKADSIAMRMGIEKTSVKRVKAFIFYYIDENSEKLGHTWGYIDDLVTEIKGKIEGINDITILKCVMDMIKADELYFEKETRRIGLKKLRNLEEAIAKELFRIKNSKTANYEYIEETIKDCEEENGYEYTTEQRKAIHNIMKENVVILTGLAGTGKSTTMKPVSRIISRNDKKSGLCCLSGKASLNLSEITNMEGKTIHRLLEFDPVTMQFTRNEKRKLVEDVIVLDEVSMVGGYLFLSLLKAIKSGAKLIMIGDMGQLESIGVANVGKDIVESGVIKHENLTQIHRQAAKSGIIQYSQKVYKGEHIIPPNKVVNDVYGELQDFNLITFKEPNDCVEKVVKIYKELHFEKDKKAEDIIILGAKRANGDTSVKSINERIQKLFTFDPYQGSLTVSYSDEGSHYEITYHPGDRIIITKNNYKCFNEQGEMTPIFNGNVGTVKWVSQMQRSMCVSLSQGDVIIEGKTLYGIQLGYAITTHKSQGSGFPYVIALIDPKAFTLISKEFLYTAITRAKKYCYCVSTPYAIRRAVETTRVYKKKTWLTELLKQSKKGD